MLSLIYKSKFKSIINESLIINNNKNKKRREMDWSMSRKDKESKL